MVVKKEDLIIMKLFHYFITCEDYNQVVVHGSKNEIWLENFEKDYRLIRIVSNYIHNNEQLQLDNYKALTVGNKIKKKTFSSTMNILNIYINLGENVEVTSDENITNINITKDRDIKKYSFLLDKFPNLTSKYLFKEKGSEAIMKITDEVNEKTTRKMKETKDIFSKKKSIMTYILCGLCILIYFLRYFIDYNDILNNFANIPEAIKNLELYRLVTSQFLHGDIFHLLFNMYALYIIGPQLEDFFGKFKFIIIYIGSGIIGNLLSLVIIGAPTIGASGAIFGLMGALLYFGYHHRVYLGNVITSQILPLIVINLFIGFISTGIDNAAHIGGLIGGITLTMGLGIKYKTINSTKINGIIITTILVIFLSYLIFR